MTWAEKRTAAKEANKDMCVKSKYLKNKIADRLRKVSTCKLTHAVRT